MTAALEMKTFRNYVHLKNRKIDNRGVISIKTNFGLNSNTKLIINSVSFAGGGGSRKGFQFQNEEKVSSITLTLNSIFILGIYFYETVIFRIEEKN